MKVIKTIEELKREIKSLQAKNIGYVPTMGFLHRGHLSLVKKAKEENDLVIMSIFVNPIQFCEGEDYEVYPRDLDRDSKLAQSAGVDIIFNPEPEEMYPKGFQTHVDVEKITDRLCGERRPGHFRGVATVLTKFFNIIKPDSAYFGQKDFQQVAVVKRMVEDLNMDINIVSCPIVREEDGLAMSSRNTYLSETDRKNALILSKSLLKSKEMILNGERDAKKLKDFIVENIEKVKELTIDYIEIMDGDTLESVEILNKYIVILLAVKVGKVRLIDNMAMEVN